jgi:signal transduction histidine kinase
MNYGNENSHTGYVFSLRRWQIWAASFAFWTVYASLDTAGSFAILALRGQRATPADVFVWNFAEAYIWVLFTPVIWAITRRYGFTGKNWKKSLAVHVPLGLVMMLVIAFLLLASLDYLGWGDTLMPFRTRLLGLAFQDLPRYFVTVAVAQIILYYAVLRQHEADSNRLETRLAQAQLEILRSQLDPHFLFNTLNSIATLTRRDPDAAEQMTLKLSSLLRVSLDCNGTQEVPLRQELQFLQSYLDIQQTRFRDRLKILTAIDPSALPIPVPSMILQPLVENAIRHGIAKSAAPGKLQISASILDELLNIAIIDNGTGMEDNGEAAIEGFGLRNTRARLQQLYGKRHKFLIESDPGKGCRVTVSLPISTPPVSEVA